jgi:hypothetical protein
MFHTEPARKGRRKPFKPEADTGLQITPYFLVGILKGSWSGQYMEDFITHENIKTDTEFNSGLSVALPAVDILEVLYQTILTVERRKILALAR